MAPHPVPSSGVLGAAGRVAEPGALRSADLRLAGGPLPVLGTARIYTCGITPYDVTHLGHAATFVWADALRGVLATAGVEVVISRNVTDVDDVLTRAAEARGKHYDEFALSQEFLFERDMDALHVHRPTMTPRARAYVPHVQQLAAALLVAGRAYEREGHVFFRGAGVHSRAGLDRAARPGARRRVRGHARRPVARRPVRRPDLAAVGGARPRLAQPVGLGPAGLARRVRGDGRGHARFVRGRPGRRRGPRVPAPRLPGGDGRGRRVGGARSRGGCCTSGR